MNYRKLLTLFFDSQPEVLDQELGTYAYKIQDNAGFVLTSCFVLCEGTVSLRLEYKDSLVYLINTGYGSEISTEHNQLKVFAGDQKQPIIQVKITHDLEPISAQFILNTPPNGEEFGWPISIGTPIPNHQIEFNDLDLLILFGNEPKVLNQETKIFEYQIKDDHGFELSFDFAVYNKYAAAQLKYKNQLVYKIDINHVSRIGVENGQINIFRDGIEIPLILVKVIPDFTPDLSLFTLKTKL